jgi:hypothetical protein
VLSVGGVACDGQIPELQSGCAPRCVGRQQRLQGLGARDLKTLWMRETAASFCLLRTVVGLKMVRRTAGRTTDLQACVGTLMSSLLRRAWPFLS